MKLDQVRENIKEIAKNREFITSGFSGLDQFLDGGFMRKELVVIGGYTGSGKSYLAGQMFFSACKKGFKGIYFSLEISNEMVVSRLVGQQANLKATRVMTGLLDPQEFKEKVTAEAKLSPHAEFMEFYDDIYELKDIKNFVYLNKPDFIVVDFIQNIMAEGKDEYARMSKVALDLQSLAKINNCCVIVLSQLSNTAYKNNYLEYKGSGSIATVCDLGFFIIRAKETPNILTLALNKNRRGISGQTFNLEFKYQGGQLSEKH